MLNILVIYFVNTKSSDIIFSGEIMRTLYIITGPAGVGKSTISNMLANSLAKSSLIEGDDIYHMIVGGYVSPWLEGNHLKLFWQNCKSLISNTLSAGYDVVFNYIVGKENLQDLAETFKDYNVKFVGLITDEKTLLQRDNNRPEDCRMGSRCLVLLKEFIEDGFDDKYILDTSNLSVSQCCNEILTNKRFLVGE